MKTLIKLAWRNIWRNRRRTLITASSILFAVLLSVFMESVQKGAWDRMVDNVVNFYFGYVQIHSKGYWDEQSIDRAFAMEGSLADLPQSVPGILTLVPRIESFALASFRENSSGVLVVGTQPIAENSMSNLSTRVVRGSYFEQEEARVSMVAEGLAQNLGIGIGDTLVLISQGYHGVNAAGKFPVKGLLKFGSPDLNKQLVYLPLAVAQEFFGAEALLTSMVVKLDAKEELKPVLKQLQTQLDTANTYEVMDWQMMMPELVQAREVDTAGNVVILLILYVIIAFGIFGTILMMIKERQYEFGVLLAIGMKRYQIGFMVWLEIVFLGFLGTLAGSIAALPLVGYFYRNPMDFTKLSKDMADAYEKFGFEPIFPAALEWSVFMHQAVVVLIITTVLAVYPFLKINSLSPVAAMHD
jgi:ABC-type lipoprotein release transport system permease subunit